MPRREVQSQRRHPLTLGLYGSALILALLVSSATNAVEVKGVRFDGEKFTCDDGPKSFQGILVKPAGKGPFPALLISHGLGSTGEQFGRTKAQPFVKAGYLCIAPTYAHSNPQGDRSDFGASPENIRRAKKCLEILESLPEVDPKRLYAYGNSMGAFLTIGLAAEEPSRLAAAAITAGGINPVSGFPAPSQAQANKIRIPICIFHGSDDTTVPPERSKLLEQVLRTNNVPCERQLFPGIGHDLHRVKEKEVNAAIEKWFQKHAKS